MQTQSTNPETLAVKLALSLNTYMQEACCLKVTAATRPLTTHEAHTLKTLTGLVDRDTAFLLTFPGFNGATLGHLEAEELEEVNA